MCQCLLKPTIPFFDIKIKMAIVGFKIIILAKIKQAFNEFCDNALIKVRNSYHVLHAWICVCGSSSRRRPTEIHRYSATLMDARNSEIKSHFQLLIIIIILIYRFSHFYILYTAKNRDIDSHYKPFNSLLYTPPKYYLPRVNMFHESSIKIDTFFSKVFVCWIIALKIFRIIFI